MPEVLAFVLAAVAVIVVEADLSRLDQIAADGDAPDDAVAGLRAGLGRQARRYRRLLDRPGTPETGELLSSPDYDAAPSAEPAWSLQTRRP